MSWCYSLSGWCGGCVNTLGCDYFLFQNGVEVCVPQGLPVWDYRLKVHNLTGCPPLPPLPPIVYPYRGPPLILIAEILMILYVILSLLVILRIWIWYHRHQKTVLEYFAFGKAALERAAERREVYYEPPPRVAPVRYRRHDGRPRGL